MAPHRVGVVGESLFVHCQVWWRPRVARSAVWSTCVWLRTISSGHSLAPAHVRLGLQYTRQRIATPDHGLRESILLPWYTALADQYTTTAFGSWKGNASLLHLYETTAFAAGENRFSRMIDPFRSRAYQDALAASGSALARD